MNLISPIFYKIFVRTFYRTNATLFFISIGIALGFMRSQDHIALGELIISSTILLLIPVSLWIGYTLHVMKFNRDEIKQNENEFVLNTVLLSKPQQWGVIALTLSYQLFPIIFYAVFLISLCALHGLISIALLVVAATLALLIVASLHLYRSLHHPNQERKQTFLVRFVQTTFTKPFALFSIEWIIRREPLVLIGTKIFSVLILFGITLLYKTDTYDFRLLAMGIVIAVTVQINLVHQIHRFDYYHFLILRNLPLTFTNRLTSLISSLFILMIPEVGLLLKNTPTVFSISYVVEALLMVMSIPVLFYGILCIKEKSQDRFMSLAFFMSMGWIIIIIFKMPAISIAIVNFLVGIFCIRKYMHSVEYSEKSI